MVLQHLKELGRRIGAAKLLLAWVALESWVAADSPPPASKPRQVSYAEDVLPLLADRCFACHGPDKASRVTDLRLDVSESATSPLDSGITAIVGGDAGASELVRRITAADPAERMPPQESGKSLSPAEVELLKRWIEQGANYQRHWAFEPGMRPELPKVRQDKWARNPIDRFTLAKLESQGLAPSPPAPREKLARRMYFDLIGLPPSSDELASVIADASPDAAGRLADKLFSSPHYGERMAIDWLDGARYADSNGYQNDFVRQMWPWRDWVVRAFNRNMPFDRFTIEQLAGDLLPQPTQEQLVATGFNRNNRTVTESGSLPEEWLVENVVDRVETTSGVFLGLTMGCARCHDHKYDPLSQKEFYEFFAFFHNIAEEGVHTEKRGNVPPMIQVPSPEQRSELAKLQHRIDEVQRDIQSVSAAGDSQLQAWIREWTQKPRKAVPKAIVQIPIESGLQGLASTGDRVVSANEKIERTEGLPGRTLRFSNGGIEYGDLFAPSRSKSFSVSLWVKPTKSGALLSKMEQPPTYRGADVTLLGKGELTVHLIHDWPRNAIKVIARRRLQENEWSHVAVTYDGSSKAAGLKLYVNGAATPFDVEVDALSDDIETDEPLRIAQRANEYFLAGELADVRLYDTRLRRGEIRAILEERLANTVANGLESLEESVRDEVVVFCSAYFQSPLDDKRIALRQELKNQERKLQEYEKSLPTVMIMEERAEPRPTFVLKRGEYHSPDMTQPVQPDVPDFLPPLPPGDRNRLALAKWIVHPDNPLTARVTVNRLWARFFGRGLVKSTENFGIQAEPPSHPELLDWLAAELISSGWDLQHIQKLIVTSATYGQTSTASPETYRQDPDNVWLSRGPRQRLPAELIRDNALSLSGLLVPDVGGRSMMPYQPEGLWEELAGGAHEDYVQDHCPLLYRRSLYIYRKRTVPHPVLNTFDAPSWEICQLRRGTTSTPMQALALLNDTTYLEAARKFAERMLAEGGETPEQRLVWAFRLATARFPTAEESSLLRKAFRTYLAEFQRDPASAKKLLAHGEAPLGESDNTEELAAYAAVASVILNLDETITKD